MLSSWDLVIVGAGPTGMGAAIEACRHGLKTLVLDRQSEAGGQIYRSVGSSPLAKALGADYAAGLPLVKEFKECGAYFETGANVWHVMPGQVFYSQNGESRCAVTCHILLATGAMERPVPVPGWELPGVMGAGASDVLLKSASLIPEGPVTLCGNGPLIFQAVEHLRLHKVPIAGILLTGRPGNMIRCMRRVIGALARPGYFMHGLYLGARTLLRSGCSWGARDIRITGDNSGLKITCESFSGKKDLNSSIVLLHEGVVPETRITRLARVRHAWNSKQRYWHADADMWGQTSVAGIRAAGDVAGILGAVASQSQGRMAGLDICRERGRLSLEQRDSIAARPKRVLARCKAMQPFLDEYFAPNPSTLQPSDDALVCRCEELSAGELKKYIEEGCYSTDGLKAQSRSGMGTCQGRMCGPAAAEMIANATGLSLEHLPPYAARPPLVPLNLGELADMDMPPDLL